MWMELGVGVLVGLGKGQEEELSNEQKMLCTWTKRVPKQQGRYCSRDKPIVETSLPRIIYLTGRRRHFPAENCSPRLLHFISNDQS